MADENPVDEQSTAEEVQPTAPAAEKLVTDLGIVLSRPTLPPRKTASQIYPPVLAEHWTPPDENLRLIADILTGDSPEDLWAGKAQNTLAGVFLEVRLHLYDVDLVKPKTTMSPAARLFRDAVEVVADLPPPPRPKELNQQASKVSTTLVAALEGKCPQQAGVEILTNLNELNVSQDESLAKYIKSLRLNFFNVAAGTPPTATKKKKRAASDDEHELPSSSSSSAIITRRKNVNSSLLLPMEQGPKGLGESNDANSTIGLSLPISKRRQCYEETLSIEELENLLARKKAAPAANPVNVLDLSEETPKGEHHKGATESIGGNKRSCDLLTNDGNNDEWDEENENDWMSEKWAAPAIDCRSLIEPTAATEKSADDDRLPFGGPVAPNVTHDSHPVLAKPSITIVDLMNHKGEIAINSSRKALIMQQQAPRLPSWVKSNVVTKLKQASPLARLFIHDKLHSWQQAEILASPTEIELSPMAFISGRLSDDKTNDAILLGEKASLDSLATDASDKPKSADKKAAPTSLGARLGKSITTLVKNALVFSDQFAKAACEQIKEDTRTLLVSLSSSAYDNLEIGFLSILRYPAKASLELLDQMRRSNASGHTADELATNLATRLQNHSLVAWLPDLAILGLVSYNFGALSATSAFPKVAQCYKMIGAAGAFIFASRAQGPLDLSHHNVLRDASFAAVDLGRAHNTKELALSFLRRISTADDEASTYIASWLARHIVLRSQSWPISHNSHRSSSSSSSSSSFSNSHRSSSASAKQKQKGTKGAGKGAPQEHRGREWSEGKGQNAWRENECKERAWANKSNDWKEKGNEKSWSNKPRNGEWKEKGAWSAKSRNSEWKTKEAASTSTPAAKTTAPANTVSANPDPSSSFPTVPQQPIPENGDGHWETKPNGRSAWCINKPE